MFHASSKVITSLSAIYMPTLGRLTQLCAPGRVGLRVNYQPLFGFSSCNMETNSLVKKKGKEVICDFGLFDGESSTIECLIVLNNELNFNLLRKSIGIAGNIILADGGANHIYD